MELQFVKFMDVKSPVGIEQNSNEIGSEFHSIGVDIYVPMPTKEFVNTILSSNKGFELDPVSFGKIINNYIESFEIYNNEKLILKFFENKYYIYDNIQIPAGLGILIPKNYFLTMNSKSSNFGLNYTIIEGFIDENYTYGMGVQLNVLNKNLVVELEPNQKFSQLILRKSEFMNSLKEIKLDDWEKLDEVKKRRVNRKGGFGSSGKF
jgi:dUTPase